MRKLGEKWLQDVRANREFPLRPALARPHLFHYVSFLFSMCYLPLLWCRSFELSVRRVLRRKSTNSIYNERLCDTHRRYNYTVNNVSTLARRVSSNFISRATYIAMEIICPCTRTGCVKNSWVEFYYSNRKQAFQTKAIFHSISDSRLFFFFFKLINQCKWPIWVDDRNNERHRTRGPFVRCSAISASIDDSFIRSVSSARTLWWNLEICSFCWNHIGGCDGHLVHVCVWITL